MFIASAPVDKDWQSFMNNMIGPSNNNFYILLCSSFNWKKNFLENNAFWRIVIRTAFERQIKKFSKTKKVETLLFFCS